MDKLQIHKKFITDHSSIIYLETDREGTITEAGKFATSLFGKELKGLNFRDFIIDFTGSVDINAMSGQPDKKHMLNVNTHSGLPQTYYFSFFQDGDKHIIFGESNDREVDELRNSFISLNSELNNLTRELQKKNSQLKKLNEQKNEFIGMAAHDLRNPISIIMGYSEFILEEAGDRLTAHNRKFMHIILNSSEYMLNMLNDLLDIARIESGKLNLNLQDIDPGKLISKNVSLNRVIAGKKDIKINIEIFENLPLIKADPDKMEQVMNNLVSNAIKYSTPGTTITISAFGSNQGITVAVKDQGLGIAENEIDKLFKPFSKLSGKSTGGEKSTGLGLSITKKIIMGHGGKIWVESQLGRGSTFCFSLPKAK